MTALGKFLRSLRIGKELSVYEMAELCGLELEVYNDIERDPGKNAGKNMSKVLSVLEMTPEDYSTFNSLAFDFYKNQMEEASKPSPTPSSPKTRPRLKQVIETKSIKSES